MANYIRYANQNATRRLPLDEDLIKRLAYLEKMGVTAHVISGGQPGIDEGGPRTGSTRHDHGHSMDADFYIGDRKLDWNNPEDLPIFQEIVSQGRAAGITGIGGADDYMGAGRLHMGMGSPAAWGAGGKSANAPKWLKEAYYGATPSNDPVAEVVAAAPSTPTTPLPNATETVEAKKPESLNGPLIQAWNKITSSDVQMPKTILGADTSKVAKGFSGLGEFAAALAENDQAINSQIQANARAGQRQNTPVEFTFMSSLPPRKKKGSLSGLGGYFI